MRKPHSSKQTNNISNDRRPNIDAGNRVRYRINIEQLSHDAHYTIDPKHGLSQENFEFTRPRVR